jgi:hypothetical protein
VNAFDWSSITASANPVGNQFYHGPTQSVIGIHSGAPGQMGQLFLDRATGFGVTDGEIVSDVGTREGYDVATDFDVTELTNTMDGYLIGRPMTGRDALQPLGNAFDWDAVESDDKIVFKGRGRASTRTIQDTELLPTDSDTFSVVDETRIQEVELPETVTVSYIDKALDYDRNAQSVKRILNPDPTMRSESKVNIAFPIVMTADQARQIAEKILFTSWNERTSYKWKTTWEHIDLDPADVVTLVINGAIVTNVRARISSVQVDRDFSMEFSGFKEESFSFTSVATGQAHPNFPQQTVPGPAFTRLFLLDIPLIRDSDDVNRISSRLHIAMNGFTSDWPGGVLYESSDGVSYNYTGLKNTVGTSYGNVLNTLPPTDLPFQTDTATQLQVSMIDGSLSSVSQSQFLDNANAAVVGTPGLNNWEIILFRDAVLGADNIYTVSTLIRGRRGTDVNVNKHLEGEFFFVLDSSALSSYFLDPSFLEVSRFYRGVGVNQILEDAETKALASNMNDLKPYSPVHLDAVLDGGNNIDISWVRRTRVGGAEPENGSDDTSLAEDSESYETDIGFFDEHHDKTVLVVKADGVDAATATTDFSPKAHALTFGTDGAGSGGEVELDTAQAKFGASSIKFANSGSVNPADSFVSAPGANFSLFDKEFTVEAWVRFNATTGAQVIMSQYLNTGDERGWWLYKASGGDLGFDYTTDGTNGTLVTNTVTWAPAINTWYHVAVTRDANNDLRFFIDGAFVGSANIGTDVIFNSSATFHLGKWRSTDDLPLDGWLDDIRVTIDVARYTDENGFSPLQIAASEEDDVVRTLNSTVQSVQYDNADITTDFGSVPDNIQIRVYQMSAQVGRGFGTTLQTVI